jgi:PKD repeat protein
MPKPISYILVVFIIASITSCKKDVTANFEPSSSTVTQGNTVNFEDKSTGEPTSWEWTFEGGTPASSTLQNPTITYDTEGSFSVTLKVNNKKTEDTKEVIGAITVNTFVNYEDQFFTDFVKTENVNYGVDATEHIMHIYEPEGDSRQERPFVFLFGGGAFQGSNLTQLEPMATELTKYGIVVGVARYRSGPSGTAIESASRMVEGQQDTRAAVRFIRANAETYRVDTNKIFHGGYGTGGYLALLHSYMAEDEIPANQINFVNSLGGWEGSQGNAGYSSEVNACISWSGGLYSSRDQILEGDVPLYCIHGDNDMEAPYDYELLGVDDTAFGPVKLIERATSKNIYNGLYTIAGGSHNSPVSDYVNYTPSLMEFIKYVVENF